MKRFVRNLPGYLSRVLYTAIVRIELMLDLDRRVMAYRRWRKLPDDDVIAPTVGTEMLERMAFLYPEYDGEYFYQVPFYRD